MCPFEYVIKDMTESNVSAVQLDLYLSDGRNCQCETAFYFIFAFLFYTFLDISLPEKLI